jgi:DNA mismatch repair ATPase MutS
LINIIVTQQFGCGFYESAVMKPYDHIHCYINIPDTSGRDSLFQAEARRCKEIIDIIQKDSNSSHFCAFDELYSGTNPDEASVSTVAFMEYIIKNKYVNTILTTHFIKVCKKLKKNKLIENYCMGTVKKKDKLEYLYQLIKGISSVKGGINVLYDMNYPSEIIENTVKSF